jgi:hypothetical protein
MKFARTLPESPARRAWLARLVGRGLPGVLWLVLSVLSFSHPGRGNAQSQRRDRSQLAPDERDRLRRDLRERGFEGWPGPQRGRGREGEGDNGRGRRQEPSRADRLSDDERRQLRRQLREADGRRR